MGERSKLGQYFENASLGCIAQYRGYRKNCFTPEGEQKFIRTNVELPFMAFEHVNALVFNALSKLFDDISSPPHPPFSPS